MNVLVTGGGGFLGEKICQQLRQRGDEVISVSRGFYPSLEVMGVRQIQADIADADAILHAVRGTDAVIHNAAKAGAWGRYSEYRKANVDGTLNIIDAMRAEGIRKLVYTSTPSVTHRAGHPVEGLSAGEVPYGENHVSNYAQTKMLAEIAVLQANDATLATTALRPRLIWGPGDQHLLPRLFARSQAGSLRMIGDGQVLVDSTYVDNAARAHLNALDALDIGSRNAGKAYFISNGEPKTLKNTINAMLDAVGEPPCDRHLPASLAMMIARLSEWSYRTLALKGEPLLTRFLVEQMTTAHWYDTRPAREDFGYEPEISFEQGMALLRKHWSATRPTITG